MRRFACLLPLARCGAWLDAVTSAATRSRTLAALPLAPEGVLQAVAASGAGPVLEAALGPAPWCNLDQSWLRHGRPPHAWHQDGALRHDFLAHAGRPAPAGAVLETRTLWIALTPCGADAPGLQWVDAALSGLLSPEELAEAAVARRFGEQAFAHAVLEPGDALLFDGLLLHRTHLLPAMRRPRTSLELRFFRAGALPARVATDRGLRLPSSGA